MLLEENEDNCNVTVAIEPPIEEATADTDCDSDASDNEVSCNPDHLPRRILLANILPSNAVVAQPSTEVGPAKKKLRKEKIIWHKDKAKVTNIVGDYQEVFQEEIRISENVLECIDKFWTDEWLDFICEHSKMYGHQKSLNTDCINKNNLRVFFGILILSRYNRLANKRLYWSTSEDVHNSLVANSMRRNTHIDQIMKCLHFTDNMKINNDRFYKVRPIFHHLNQVMKAIKPSSEFTSVDEIMVSYYGRHGDKQFIRGKPVRFGFKLWGACTSNGTLLHAEPYCGSHTNISDYGFGHGPNVVLEMVNKTELKAGQHVVCDNYFGSIPLLKELSEKSYCMHVDTKRRSLRRCSIEAKNIDE